MDSFGSLVFGGGVYFLMWSDDGAAGTNGGYDNVYGAMVTPSGQVAVSDFEIARKAVESEAGQSPAAFDGTNFLAVWSGAAGGTSIQGRLISPAGEFVTGPFVIFTNSVRLGPALNAVAFDGTKYLVLFTCGTVAGSFSSAQIEGRFVTTAGEVLPNKLTLTSDPGPQLLPCVAFDGTHFLVTWNQGFNPNTTTEVGAINGRLLDTNGIPSTAEFNLFESQNGRVPFFAPVLFDGTQFFSAAGLGRKTEAAPNLSFTNGTLSGAFIVP